MPKLCAKRRGYVKRPLDAGPLTINLPDAGKRFMSMQTNNEDQYTPLVAYKSGKYVLSRKDIGTRYVVAALRTFVNPNEPEDAAKAHALRDAIKAEQKAPGSFEVPKWWGLMPQRRPFNSPLMGEVAAKLRVGLIVGCYNRSRPKTLHRPFPQRA